MALVSSVKVYKAQLVEALEQRYVPALRAGEEPLAWDLVLAVTVRDVQAALARLVELDDRVDDAELAHDELRQSRRRLVQEELYPEAVLVRGAIDLAFGREEGRHVHRMKGRTARKAPALARQLRRTLHRLEGDRALPSPRGRRCHVDRDGWIGQLKPGYRKLVKLNRQLVLSDKALIGLYLDKQAAMTAFDQSYGDGLRHLRSVFRMARFDPRAIKNLRPYYMRRRLSKRARLKRAARAGAAEQQPATPPAEAPARSPAGEGARVIVPRTVARWLEKSRLFGT